MYLILCTHTHYSILKHDRDAAAVVPIGGQVGVVEK